MARPPKEKKVEYTAEQLEQHKSDVAMDAEVRRTRLKTLIILGKERGYLTYAEINDHLPDDTQDSEQIDGIIGLEYTFNEIPLNLAIDWIPLINIADYPAFWGGGVGLSVRYAIK